MPSSSSSSSSSSRMLQGSHIILGCYGDGDERAPAPAPGLLLRLSLSGCVRTTVLLPLLGLSTCVFISSVFHFDDSTATHCQVPNYLPSISAAISLEPEGHIWRLCIGLHSAPRFLLSVTYFRFYKGHFSSRFPESSLVLLNVFFSVSENLGLLLLTYVSSNETYSVHKGGFLMFIICSIVYMITTCRLWSRIKRYSLNPEDAKSYRWKVRLLTLNVSFCAFAGYFYGKHNMYCEPGSYTFFALFEYLVVLTNMAFHLTAVWDFKSRELIVMSPNEEKVF